MEFKSEVPAQPLGGDKSEYVNPYIPTQPPPPPPQPRKIKVTIYAVTRLTANFMCGLMSDLVICKLRKSMVIHDTECPD